MLITCGMETHLGQTVLLKDINRQKAYRWLSMSAARLRPALSTCCYLLNCYLKTCFQKSYFPVILVDTHFYGSLN